MFSLLKSATFREYSRAAIFGWIVCLGTVAGAGAQTPKSLVIDDFEKGVAAWTRNDKVKTDNPAADVLLVDVVATTPGPGGVPGSKGAGMFAFKAAKNSWASASIRIDGAQWARIGAQRLTFWLNAGGDVPGVAMRLRRTYRAPDGSSREEVFNLPKPVRLDVKNWRRVVIPLSDFKSPNGSLPTRMNGLYLLQFVQERSWDSRFFLVDDLRVEGTGVPIEG